MLWNITSIFTIFQIPIINNWALFPKRAIKYCVKFEFSLKSLPNIFSSHFHLKCWYHWLRWCDHSPSIRPSQRASPYPLCQCTGQASSSRHANWTHSRRNLAICLNDRVAGVARRPANCSFLLLTHSFLSEQIQNCPKNHGNTTCSIIDFGIYQLVWKIGRRRRNWRRTSRIHRSPTHTPLTKQLSRLQYYFSIYLSVARHLNNHHNTHQQLVTCYYYQQRHEYIDKCLVDWIVRPWWNNQRVGRGRAEGTWPISWFYYVAITMLSRRGEGARDAIPFAQAPDVLDPPPHVLHYFPYVLIQRVRNENQDAIHPIHLPPRTRAPSNMRRTSQHSTWVSSRLGCH